MESDYRKDGYYVAILRNPDGQLNIEVVRSHAGLLYNLPNLLHIPSEMVVEVFIDSRVDEVYLPNNPKNTEST